MNLLTRPAFMAFNSVLDIILTYHQKIGESLKIIRSEFMPGTSEEDLERIQ